MPDINKSVESTVISHFKKKLIGLTTDMNGYEFFIKDIDEGFLEDYITVEVVYAKKSFNIRTVSHIYDDVHAWIMRFVKIYGLKDKIYILSNELGSDDFIQMVNNIRKKLKPNKIKKIIREAFSEHIEALMRKHLVGKEYVDERKNVKATITNVEVGGKSVLIDLVTFLGVASSDSPIINIKVFIYDDLKRYGFNRNHVILDIHNVFLHQEYFSLVSKYKNETTD
jgi:hypothetical protein